MEHVIKKQVIDLCLDKKLDAFAIQQKVSTYYWNKVVPALVAVFDDVSDPLDTISIDRLEIDLGIITESELVKGFWEEQVHKKVTEQLIPVKLGFSRDDRISKHPATRSNAGQWLFYMQNGYLPWSLPQLSTDWYKNVLEAFAADTASIALLRQLVLHHPRAVKRIIHQHSDFFLTALVETLTARNQQHLAKTIREMALFICRGTTINGYPQADLRKKVLRLWEEVFYQSASAGQGLDLSAITRRLFKKSLFIRPGVIPLKPGDRSNADRVIGLFAAIPNTEGLPSEETGVPDELNNAFLAGVDEEGIFVRYAGMVLLHPFLAAVFRNLGWIDESGNFYPSTRPNAILILHYLASGNIHPPEHELVMAKILCACPLHEPVDTDIELMAAELAEADGLLLELIKQWDILKGTSPAGLREGFLQRNGKVFTKNDSLWLQVEPSSIDVLLDQLPWNLGMVMLPWMPAFLRVEWR